jgi:hypothetical protein
MSLKKIEMIGVSTLWRDFKNKIKNKKIIEMNIGGVDPPIGHPKGHPSVLKYYHL